VQLDSPTLLAAGSAMLMLLGVLFFFIWLRHRDTPALLWWSFPFIFGGAAALVYLRPNWSSDFPVIAIGNAARIFAVGCLWQGIRIFEGRRPALRTLLGLCLLWIALCLIPGFITSMLARVVVASLFIAGFCGMSAWELWRNRREALASRWPTMLIFASFGVFSLVRSIVAPWTPFPVGVGPVDPIWLAVFLWVLFGHAAFAAVFFLAMTLERREAEQRSFALSDPLTGLMNRRAFTDFVHRYTRRRNGTHSTLALLVLDLDKFKSINDRYGHEAGDRMLKQFADVAESNVRPSDMLFRMGGEEFCFAMPDTSLSDAIVVAERIRKAFEATEIETRAGPAMTTVSIGIAATQFAVDVEVLLAAADAAVYEAKARGRNRVVVAEPAALSRQIATEDRRVSRLRA
jgi:diguanylate cyclase (GGDEF)-like protein